MRGCNDKDHFILGETLSDLLPFIVPRPATNWPSVPAPFQAHYRTMLWQMFGLEARILIHLLMLKDFFSASWINAISSS
jgi:hypothetical protein